MEFSFFSFRSKVVQLCTRALASYDSQGYGGAIYPASNYSVCLDPQEVEGKLGPFRGL
jgi:hypothetical protein